MSCVPLPLRPWLLLPQNLDDSPHRAGANPSKELAALQARLPGDNGMVNTKKKGQHLAAPSIPYRHVPRLNSVPLTKFGLV